MITITDVCDHLVSCNPKLLQPPQKDDYLRDIYFLTTNDSGDSSVLYMGTVSTILQIVDRIRHSNLLLIEDVPFSTSIRSRLLQQGCSFVVLPKENDVFEIFNLVKKLFSERQWFYQQSYNLYNELLTGKDFSHIIGLAEKELNNPIILIDESFKVLHYSTGITVTDEIWANNIRKGYCSYEFVLEVNKLNSVRKSPTTTEPFSVVCHANEITKWISKLYWENELMGYLVVPECQSHMEREQVQLFSVFSKIMVHHLSRTKHENANQLINSEKLFTDLIENRIQSESELSSRLKLSGLSLNKPYYLIMLKDDSVEARRKKTESLHSQLSKLYPEGQQIIYKNSLLLLVSQKEWDSHSNSKKQSLLEILKQKNLRAIYSDYITDLLDLSSHYHCLVKGSSLAERLDRREVLLPYSDLKFYQMLHDMVDSDKLLYYCHPEILKLLNYDIENNTAYYETLQAFLLNRQNLNDTANQLFIHRNTIKYRLRKINQIVEIDLTRGETVFQLAYSFKILNYLKK